MRLKTGSVFARRFVLGKCVAAGPATRIWRATDQASGELRAVKFLAPDIVGDSDQTVRVLWDLIASTRKIDHPSVVIADGAVAADGHVAIVTPWIDGSTLEEKRRRQPRRRFDYDMIRGLVCAWAETMQAVEKLRLVHGALKPSNLMLDASGELKITDFGTGAWLATELGRRKRYGSLESSLPYLSPAQIGAGGGSYWRDDTFAFGAIIYELLTGAPPFPKRKIRANEPAAMPALISRRRDRIAIPSEVEEVIMVCLEANPAHRPASFRRILSHLDPLLPIPAAARQKNQVLQPASAATGGTGTSVPPSPSNGLPPGDGRVADSTNGHPRFSDPSTVGSRLADMPEAVSARERASADRMPSSEREDQSWYENAMAHPSAQQPSRSWGWLLKTVLVLVACGLIAVGAAFAWIVTGHELVIPQSLIGG